jgi:hypothetical protein
MINIKKFDSVALSVKEVLQQEALKGQQHKIDKNKNNKIDAHDFKILRGEKKGMKKEEAENVEESNNPFDLKNYKSQLPTKPGEKAGFDSKKVSTGTIYSRKPVKDEPMKKEEVEQIDELTLSDLVARSRKQKFDTEAEMKHHRLVDGKPSVPKRVGSKDIHLHHIGTGNSTGENAKYKVVAAGAKSPLKAKVGSTISGKKVNDHMDTSGEGGTVHVHTARPKAHFMDDDMHEEVQHVEERTLTKGETSEKERIVKGMKKSLKGFKARYGDKAKSVMYATATKAAKNEEVVTEAKRPESDTVPFITNGDSLPLQHAKNLAKKSMKRMKSEMMGKTGTSE